MLFKSFNSENFSIKNSTANLKRKLKKIIEKENEILKSLNVKYKDSFDQKKIKKKIKNKDIRIIGMGGSILGAEAIYSFLKKKIEKNFSFIDNLSAVPNKLRNKKITNLIISKSGNTLETISNVNVLVKKSHQNIFITENHKSYLFDLAKKLKAEIIYHNNYIGGRYSVLSEVGMLPATLMGLNPKKFRCLTSLVKKQSFINNLINNTAAILYFLKKNKSNSIILNYDQKSKNFFAWYQQLVSESLGKKGKGVVPIISEMPKDNHSMMQLYLDGPKKNFFTFFYCKEKKSEKIYKKYLDSSHNYLVSKSLDQIIYSQKKATENVFRKKNIPFRSFEINKRDEESLGELFCYFILETILLGRAMNIDPFNQPSVELIKRETRKQLV